MFFKNIFLWKLYINPITKLKYIPKYIFTKKFGYLGPYIHVFTCLVYFVGCCGTFCVPCLSYNSAEKMGESGIVYGLITCLAPCIGIWMVRSKAQEKYGIEVSIYTRVLILAPILELLCIYSTYFISTAQSNEHWWSFINFI